MSAAAQPAEERTYCCCVVSVGYDAHTALRDVAREDCRGWYAIAVGPHAGRARADRTLHTDDDGEPAPEALLPALGDVWSSAEFVYVVFDQRDPTARALALPILEAAHAPDRLTAAVLLGITKAAHAEPAALLCSAVIRVADKPADELPNAADVLRGLLSVFEACAFPMDLESLAACLRANRDSRVVMSRADGDALHRAVPRRLAGSGADAPCLLHLVCGEAALTFSAARDALEAVPAHAPDLSANITCWLPPNEVLVTAVIPVPRRPLGAAARRLWTLAADRAAERFPRGGRSFVYEQRMRHELQSFWGARDQNAEMLLWLADQIERLRSDGHAVGPALGNAGGSLAAYLLGLSVFDPVEWELSFEEFVNGRDMVLLEPVVSLRTVAEHELARFHPSAAEGPRPIAFVADPRLDDVGHIDDWRRVLDETRATLARKVAEASRHATGLESDIAVVPGIAAITGCSDGRLLHDHQITAAISQLMMVSYPDADRVRRLLAKGGASADEAIARLVGDWTRGHAGAPVCPVVERLRQRALTSTPRSVALSDALIELARTRTR